MISHDPRHRGRRYLQCTTMGWFPVLLCALSTSSMTSVMVARLVHTPSGDQLVMWNWVTCCIWVLCVFCADQPQIIIYIHTPRVATPTDMENYTTPTDMENYTTPTHMENYTTHTDMENYTTPTDMENYTTPTDMENYTTHTDMENYPKPSNRALYSKNCYWLGVTLKGSTYIHMPTTHQPVPHFKQSVARSHPPWQLLGTGSLWCSHHEPPAPHSQW